MQIHSVGIDRGKKTFHLVPLAGGRKKMYVRFQVSGSRPT
jgi:hypothetical protein